MSDLVKSIKEFAGLLNKTQKLPCSYGAGDCIITVAQEGQDIPLAMCLKARQLGEVTWLDSWTRTDKLRNMGCPEPREKHFYWNGQYKCKYADGKVHQL